MAGTLTISTLSDGTNSTSSTNCIQGSAKAWVNFNGANGTRRGYYNVSSVTRNSTGNYTINFASPLADGNYSAVSSASYGNDTQAAVSVALKSTVSLMTANSYQIVVGNSNTGGANDYTIVCSSVFR